MTFSTKKTISGSQYTLNMSDLVNDKVTAGIDVKRQLMMDHEYIEGGKELNAAVINLQGGSPTLFRMLMTRSSSMEQATHVVRGEDVVTFYHKQSGAYLHLEPKISPQPFFYDSERVSDKLRKKCHWLWKIEYDQLYYGGEPVSIADDTAAKYRIKHVVTNMYLIQAETQLQVTSDYLDPRTLFSFRPFSKTAASSELGAGEMAFIKGSTGDYLILKEGADLNATRTPDNARAVSQVGGDGEEASLKIKHRMMPVKMSTQELLPDSDALLVTPVRKAALLAVVSVRRYVLVLIDYKKQLLTLPDCQPNSNPAGGRSNGRPGAVGKEGVLQVTTECFELLERALRKLVINCSWGKELDPMARDGTPNKYVDKVRVLRRSMLRLFCTP